jgi:DNA-binding IscR family transcriptional regulator
MVSSRSSLHETAGLAHPLGNIILSNSHWDILNTHTKCPCLIKVVMLEAEDQMRQYLKNKTLAWLHEQVQNKLPEEHRKATAEWFNIAISK